MNKDTDEYKRWHLEQMINFGLNGEKISRKELAAHIEDIQIDPYKKSFMKFLLSSHGSTD